MTHEPTGSRRPAALRRAAPTPAFGPYHKVGILSGFGSLAGAHFYKRLVELTPASDDADHLPVVLMTDPSTPSRLLHLAHRGPSPAPHLIRLAQSLVAAGADLLVIPSATCHAYYHEVSAAVSAPILHLPTVVMRAVAAAGVRRLAVMATTPTVALGFYEGPAREAGVRLIAPDAATQEDVMRVIRDIKAGREPAAARSQLATLSTRPWATGADGLLLGCTELPAVYPHALRPQTPPMLDATDELARAVVRHFGRQPD